ncbi:hypothetical protein EV714DRAFT_274596 [Schizophyllum commune]
MSEMRPMLKTIIFLIAFVDLVYCAGYSPALPSCAELCIPDPCNGVITDACFCKDAVLNCIDGVCYSPTEYLQATEAFGSYCPV